MKNSVNYLTEENLGINPGLAEAIIDKAQDLFSNLKKEREGTVGTDVERILANEEIAKQIGRFIRSMFAMLNGETTDWDMSTQGARDTWDGVQEQAEQMFNDGISIN